VRDACVRSTFGMAVDGSAEAVIFFAPVPAAGFHGSRSVQVEVTRGLRPHALIGERDRSAMGLRQADDRAARPH
jgi:hypothetical protein